MAPNLAKLEWLRHGFGLRTTEPPAGAATLRQIHSGVVVEAPEGAGDRFAEGDAIVSAGAGAVIGIRTADCVPILLADRRTRAVACIHAGWRGTAEAIVAGALREMERRYGTAAGDVCAAVGPGIGVCCYEVGPEVARRFGTWAPELTQTETARRIDLPRINELQLAAAGVRDVWQAGECTFCSADRYFSFRREGERAGRMLSYIGRVE